MTLDFRTPEEAKLEEQEVGTWPVEGQELAFGFRWLWVVRV